MTILVAPISLLYEIHVLTLMFNVGFRKEIRALRSAFPDFEPDVVHLLADGDKVIAHLRGRGTHLGDFGGIAPTGTRVDAASITIIRFANGKFAERWNLVDRYGWLQQLGVIPSSSAS